MEDQYLTPKEIARKLRVSSQVVRKWLRNGKVEGFKVGRQWRVKKESLEHFLNPKKSVAKRTKKEDPLLDIIGCISSEPTPNEEIDRELYDANSPYRVKNS